MPPNPTNCPPSVSKAAVTQAAVALKAGDLVAFPTETVYGLGADATQAQAVAKIFSAKGRPLFNPLIVHVADLASALKIGAFTPAAEKLAQAFWPGGLTLVVGLRHGANISDLVTAGLATLAIRVPSHPVAQALLRAADTPIAAPSANRSGHVSATTAAHVAADFGPHVTHILDGGPTQCGLESTILDVSQPTPILLRPGAITTLEIAAVTGRALPRHHHVISTPSADLTTAPEQPAPTAPGQRAPTAPGQLESHYAPRAPLRCNAHTPMPGEALLAFGPDVPAHTGPTINLSLQGDLVEAANGLFAALRALDATGCSAIAVMPIPNTGLGEAINDRLNRAAAPRPNTN